MQAVDQHLVGWILTMLAVSLGAPFWFDTLNRISFRERGQGTREAKAVGPPQRGAEEAVARQARGRGDRDGVSILITVRLISYFERFSCRTIIR